MITEFTLTDMVNLLKRKRTQTPTVLILGSRAGGLFHSNELYETMKLYGDPSFNKLPNLERFAECYRLFDRATSGFGVANIGTILNQSLKHTRFTHADICLAELVKSGIFDTILTSTMDNTLEQALESVGLSESYDFDVFSLHPGIAKEKLLFRNNVHCHIIKVFGELISRDYTMKRAGYITQNQEIRHYLETFSREDLIIIGLDPVWDAEIYHIFPTEEGGSLWFINEEALSEDSRLYHVADARNGQTFIGENANYERFMAHLHRAFFSTNLPERDGTSSDNQTAPSRVAKKPLKIFISSVSQDDALLNALLTHMTGLKHEKLVDTWYSHKILAGQVIQAEIDQHLQSASLILLLVSADFIASDYINNVELKRAMQRHNTGKARVIPIIVRPCSWEGSVFGNLRALPSNGKPIKSAYWSSQDDALLDIVQGIRDVANTPL